MAGKGAPKGNKYAARNGEGIALTIYLSQIDIQFLQRYMKAQDKNPEQWRKEARRLAKNGIYREIKSYMDAEIL